MLWGGNSSEKPHKIQALIVVALGWAILPLFGALPFYLIAHNVVDYATANQQSVIPTIEVSQQPLNAVFEAYSGFTSAGRTMAIAPSQLPHALQWWRSLMQWVGGVGVIVLMLTIVEPEVDAKRLYDAPVQLALMLIMILGAMSFATHHLLLHRRRLSALFHDLQHRWLWSLLILGSLALMLENQIVFADWLPLKSAFQWVSALTTCGFASDRLQFWSPLGKLLMVFAMICGGASGSTTAGIKLSRVSMISLGIYWRFRNLLNDSDGTITYRVGEEQLSQKQAFERLQSAALIFCLWIGAIACGVAVLLHQVPTEYNLADVIFVSASALGGVWLSVGIAGVAASGVTKLTIILLMWMGRLEIVPVLLLLWLPFATVATVRPREHSVLKKSAGSEPPLIPSSESRD